MDSRRYERVAEIFNKAREVNPDERAAFLDEACRGDPQLREDVESLLRHDQEKFDQKGDDIAGYGIRAALVNMASGNETPHGLPWIGPLEAPEFAGQRLGDFEVVREIGRGGMAVVFEARQISLDRRVALKVLDPRLGLSPAARTRFEREARAASMLHHPNIVPVHATGESDSYHFYAMDLVEGRSLSDLLDDLRSGRVTDPSFDAMPSPPPEDPSEPVRGTRPTSPTETTGRKSWYRIAARLVVEVAEALDYAHSRGVIHRDIKPSNLLLSPQGRLLITDFGIARLIEEPGTTITGSFLGTPAFMSPEQIAGGRTKLDHRTDIYSLGVVLYEMLTLTHPFPGESRDETITSILTADVRRPRKINPHVPVDLETICLKAMEKNPAGRYETAGQMALDLRRYLEGGPITARRAGALRRSARFLLLHPALAGSIATVVLVLLTAFSIYFWQHQLELYRLREQILEVQHCIERGGTPSEGFKSFHERREFPEAYLVWAQSSLHLAKRGWESDGESTVLSDAKRRISADLSDWSTRYLIAGLRRTQGKIDVAERLEEKARTEMPDTAEALYVRSFTTLDPDEALKFAKRASSRAPDKNLSRFIRERMAHLYMLADRFEKALETGQQLIQRHGERAGWMLFVGRLQARLGRYVPALKSLSRAVELEPEHHTNYRVRATVHLCLHQLEESIADYSRAVELLGGICVWERYQRATALWMSGRFSEAAEDNRKVREHRGHASCADLRRFLILRDHAEYLQNTGRVAQARARYKDAEVLLSTLRGDDTASDWIMKILDCLAGALAPEELVAAVDPTDGEHEEQRCEAYYYAGEACLLKGDTEAAVKWFELCVGTELAFDLNCRLGQLDPMSEYHLAQWRLEQLSADTSPQ